MSLSSNVCPSFLEHSAEGKRDKIEQDGELSSEWVFLRAKEYTAEKREGSVRNISKRSVCEEGSLTPNQAKHLLNMKRLLYQPAHDE